MRRAEQELVEDESRNFSAVTDYNERLNRLVEEEREYHYKIDSLLADEEVRMPLETQQLATKEKSLEPWSQQVDLQADLVANREAELAAAKQRLRNREAYLAADERRMRQREAEVSAFDRYMSGHE